MLGTPVGVKLAWFLRFLLHGQQFPLWLMGRPHNWHLWSFCMKLIEAQVFNPENRIIYMLEKTAAKLKRRFELMPLHHVDASVIMELEKTIDGRFCRRYIHKLNYDYRGIIPSPALSDLQ